jgi:hypothetical protein
MYCQDYHSTPMVEIIAGKSVKEAMQFSSHPLSLPGKGGELVTGEKGDK